MLPHVQGRGFLAQVTAFMAVLVGCGGGLAGGDHTVGGFLQKNIEVFAVFRILVGIACCRVASLGLGCLFQSFKPLCLGHVFGLGTEWDLGHLEAGSRSSSRGQNPALAGA